MGFIRGSLLVIVGTLFFLSIFVGNMFLTLSLSLDYDNVGPELITETKELLETQLDLDSVIGEQLVPMELYCQNHSEFVFNEMGNTFVIPCEIMSQGFEVIVDYAIRSIVNQVYYTEYDCEFWDCLEKTGSPSVLISEKAKNYWNAKFYLLLTISAGLAVLMLLLIQKKTSLPLVIGSLLIISSLPFMKLDSLIGRLINPVFSIMGVSDILPSSFLDIFSIFFSKSYRVFLIMFISGIVLLIIGILFKIFKIGFKISNFLSKKNVPDKSIEIKKDSNKNVQNKPVEIKKDSKKKSK